MAAKINYTFQELDLLIWSTKISLFLRKLRAVKYFYDFIYYILPVWPSGVAIVTDFGSHDQRFLVRTPLSPTDHTFRYTLAATRQLPRPCYTDVDHNKFSMYGLIKALAQVYITSFITLLLCRPKFWEMQNCKIKWHKNNLHLKKHKI